MKMCDGCPYPLDGKGHAAGCQRDYVMDLVRERDGLEQNVAHYRERAEAAERAVSMLRTTFEALSDQISEHAYQEIRSVLDDAPVPSNGLGTKGIE